MKKILFLSFAVALCGCNTSRYAVEGTLAGVEADSVVLRSQTDPEAPVLARAAVGADGAFSLRGETTAPGAALLATSKGQPLALLFVEPGRIALTQTPEGGMAVAGTPLNDAFAPLQRLIEKNQREAVPLMQTGPQERLDSLEAVNAEAIRRTVAENNDNILGLYLLNAALPHQMEVGTARELQKGFPAEFAQHPLMLAVEKSLTAIESTAVGSSYMDIALPDADGNTVRLSEVGAGKWVLIDFWASWCGPCRREMPFLREAVTQFAERGFMIYGVSLDASPERWKEAMAKEEMTWTNVAAVKDNVQDPILEQYGVRTIPANYLVAPDGKIAAKDLRGEALIEKLAQVLPEVE